MAIRVWPVTLVGMLLTACATAPPSSPPSVLAAPALAAQMPDDPYAQTAVLDKRAREMGYRIETRDGERRYCRNTAPTGSHIPREGCLSADFMARTAKAADDDQDQISRRQMQTCSGCANNGPIH